MIASQLPSFCSGLQFSPSRSSDSLLRRVEVCVSCSAKIYEKCLKSSLTIRFGQVHKNGEHIQLVSLLNLCPHNFRASNILFSPLSGIGAGDVSLPLQFSHSLTYLSLYISVPRYKLTGLPCTIFRS